MSAEIIEHTYKRLYATYQNHDIVIERKDIDVTEYFYILVTAPSGLAAYDGYWPHWGIVSETMDDALTEALAGSGLLDEEDEEAR